MSQKKRAMNLRALTRVALGFGIALLVSSGSMRLLVPASGAMASAQFIIGLALLAFYFAANEGALGRAFSGKGIAFYGISTLVTAALIAALIGLNVMAVQAKVSWDLTRERVFTLAPETQDLLGGLKEDVRISAFYSPADPNHEGVRQLLDRYRAQSDHIVVEMIDPEREPTLVQARGITAQGPRILLEKGGAEARATDPTEEGLTNALRRLLHGSTVAVYFTAGHGEGSLSDATSEEGFGLIAKRLGDEGIRYETLYLSGQVIPEDAAALVILAPERPFLEGEISSLRSWLEDGGRLFVALEPTFQDQALLGLLSEYGFLFEEALVIDPLSKAMGGADAIPVVQTFADHPITRGFQLQTVFPTARPISARGDVDPRPLILATTNPSSWGALDWQRGSVEFDPEREKRGALGLVAVTSRGEGAEAIRVVAVGDADFANNRFVQVGGNADLFLNSLNWLASQEDRITIRPKSRRASRLILTELDARFLNFFSISAMPMLVLAVGLSVWLVRRSR